MHGRLNLSGYHGNISKYMVYRSTYTYTLYMLMQSLYDHYGNGILQSVELLSLNNQKSIMPIFDDLSTTKVNIKWSMAIKLNWNMFM